MSGWIKLEKSLADDPRVLAMSRLLPGHRRATVIGGLALLWSYADTHIEENNQLAIGPEDIDQLVGVPGFAKALPADWLVVINGQRVELPEFHAHNGSTAKRRRAWAARQSRKRHATVTRDNDTSHANVTPQDRDRDRDQE